VMIVGIAFVMIVERRKRALSQLIPRLVKTRNCADVILLFSVSEPALSVVEGCLRGRFSHHPRYPFAFSNSAFSRAAPAAPRIVLCDRTVNFQSRTLHLRKWPTAVVMPPPRSTSKRGCGRSGAVMYRTGCSGALGRRRCCGSARKSFQAAMISSGSAYFFSRIAIDSVWPSSTATRLHCALMAKGAGSIRELFSVPSNFCVSSSIFSSSLAM
jgi:hypothetical protein